jgi:hypothetical protein
MHLVLWTGKSAQELLEMEDIVVAQLSHVTEDRELYNLVTKLQVHKCGNYCKHERIRNACRFGFPHPYTERSCFDPITNRSVYKRSDIDGFINPYNPYLLKLTKVSMDIQVNHGDKTETKAKNRLSIC